MTYLSNWKEKEEEDRKEILSQISKIVLCLFGFAVLFYIAHSAGGTP